MSKADEMFEELGFEKEENSSVIFYTQKIKAPNYTERTIAINNYDRSFQGTFTQKNIGGKGIEHFPLFILPIELQAINEKCKELGWKELTDEYMIQKHLINPDFLKNYISKDKIREKIEEYSKERYIAGEHLVVNVLQELLEEK